MAHDWFRVPLTGSGTWEDEFRPDLKGHKDDVDGSGGAPQAQSSRYIVRVYGPATVLDALANEPQVNNTPVRALERTRGLDLDAERVNAGWQVE